MGLNTKISENEQPFYPDQEEKCWQYIIYIAIIFGLSLLVYVAIHATGGQVFLFLMFFITLVYVLYIGYFIKTSPRLYIDKAHTYLRIQSSLKDEIVYLNDIQSYKYFTCYANPLKYPFLCLCVQLFLYNGQNVEFFAFMRGAQIIIDNKMSSLGLMKK